jgi:hypothetical protein
MVTAGVIDTLKLQEERVQPKPTRILPRATPAQEPLTLQERRAAERGRGRKARAPLQIPWRGWKDIFVRTYYEILDDRLLALLLYDAGDRAAYRFGFRAPPADCCEFGELINSAQPPTGRRSWGWSLAQAA